MPGHVRRFGTNTCDLEAVAELLRQAGVDTVAMESTGIYWVPLFDLLQSKGFRVLLADARQTADTPGRPKSDVKDCMWIQRLHSLGLLRAAFRPEEPVRVWRVTNAIAKAWWPTPVATSNGCRRPWSRGTSS